MSSEIILDAVPYAGQAYALLEKAGLIERVKDWLGQKTAQEVIVVGASGTGKSSFLRMLSGQNPNINRSERTTASTAIIGKLEGSYFRLMDTPGQEDDVYKIERRKAILEAAKEKRLGIINVVSFGFHEETVKVPDAVKAGRPRAEFLEQRRQLEIDLLVEWRDTLCGRGGAAASLITVVTKADLWWSGGPDQTALIHYHSGPYFDALGEARTIPHDVLPYSSQNQLFYSQAPMSGFYTDEQRVRDHNRLVAKMLANASEPA